MIHRSHRVGPFPISVLSLIVACVGLSCGRLSASRLEQGRTVAAAFLDEVRAGRIDPAWQGTTVEFKSLMGSDSLRDYTRTHPALQAPAEFVESRPVESSGGKLGEYQFRSTPPSKGRVKSPPSPKSIRLLISFAEGTPRIERLTSE